MCNLVDTYDILLLLDVSFTSDGNKVIVRDKGLETIKSRVDPLKSSANSFNNISVCNATAVSPYIPITSA